MVRHVPESDSRLCLTLSDYEAFQASDEYEVPRIRNRLPSSGAPSDVSLYEPVCDNCNIVIEGEVCKCIDGKTRCYTCWEKLQLPRDEVRLGKNR